VSLGVMCDRGLNEWVGRKGAPKGSVGIDAHPPVLRDRGSSETEYREEEDEQLHGYALHRQYRAQRLLQVCDITRAKRAANSPTDICTKCPLPSFTAENITS